VVLIMMMKMQKPAPDENAFDERLVMPMMLVDP
jgi:hypothetical protein